MFEIYKNPKNNEFYFRLKALNGQKILSSEGYKSKNACLNGIESVKKNSTSKKNFQVKEAKNGKFYFNLKAANGQIIGNSQMYANMNGLNNGINSVQNNAKSSIKEVED